MWVIKAKGETYYVDHVTSNVHWSTKETPDNNHTKGSIKLKNVDVFIEDGDCKILSVKEVPAFVC